MNTTHKPHYPLYVYPGTDDNITTPIGDTDQLVSGSWKAGTKVRYVRYVGRDHGQALIAGMYPVWTWITARFNGFPVLECSVKDVTKADGEEDDDDHPDIAEKGLGAGLKEEGASFGQNRLSSEDL